MKEANSMRAIKWLACIYAVLVGMSDAGGQWEPSGMEAAGGFSEYYSFGADVLLRYGHDYEGLVDFYWSDFDGDGAGDLLVLDALGVHVAWGYARGGVGESVLVHAVESTTAPPQVVFNRSRVREGGPDCWLAVRSDSGKALLEAFRFDGRQFVAVPWPSEPFDGAVRWTESGLLYGATRAGGIVLNDRVAADAPCRPEDLDCFDVDGDGQEDLLVECAGRLGVALSRDGRASEWEWLSDLDGEMERVSGWVPLELANGTRGVWATMAPTGKLVRYTYDGAWERMELMAGKSGFVLHERSDQIPGLGLFYQPNRTQLLFRNFNAPLASGSMIQLAEASDGRFAHVLDWDGDGDDDVVSIDPLQKKVHAIPNIGLTDSECPAWSRDVLQRFDGGAAEGLLFPLPARKAWQAFEQPVAGMREWAMAEGAQWGLGDTEVVYRGSRPHPIAPPQSEAEVPCVHVGFLEYAPGLTKPCLSLDPEKDWHRITYSRGPTGRTAVAIDGELRFEGFTEQEMFHHRVLNVAATVWGNWQHHATMDIDEIQAFHRYLSPDELLAFHTDDLSLPEWDLVDRVDFDAPDALKTERWEYDVLTEGSPVLVPSPWGRAMRFDGKPDRMECIFVLPTDSVVQDFRFRLHSPVDRRMHVLSVAGLFRVDFEMVIGRPLEGVAKSPHPFFDRQTADTMGGHWVTWGGRLLRLLPSGLFMSRDGMDWRIDRLEDLPVGQIQASPWTQAGVLYAVFGDDRTLWQCANKVTGWQRVGKLAPDVPTFSQVVSTGHWAFTFDQEASTAAWVDVHGGGCYPATPIAGKVHAVRAHLNGVEWLDGAGYWREVAVPDATVAPVLLFAQPTNWMERGGWIVGGAVLLGGIFLASTGKRKKQSEATSEESLAEMRSMRIVLERLIPYSGEQLDSEALDACLLISEHVTAETARSGRSRLIKRLNDFSILHTGASLIVRFKDPKDRRRFIYTLEADPVALLAVVERRLAARHALSG